MFSKNAIKWQVHSETEEQSKLAKKWAWSVLLQGPPHPYFSAPMQELVKRRRSELDCSPRKELEEEELIGKEMLYYVLISIYNPIE